MNIIVIKQSKNKETNVKNISSKSSFLVKQKYSNARSRKQ